MKLKFKLYSTRRFSNSCKGKDQPGKDQPGSIEEMNMTSLTCDYIDANFVSFTELCKEPPCLRNV